MLYILSPPPTPRKCRVVVPRFEKNATTPKQILLLELLPTREKWEKSSMALCIKMIDLSTRPVGKLQIANFDTLIVNCTKSPTFELSDRSNI